MEIKIPSHTFHDCCNAILIAARESKTKALNYAVGYAGHGLNMPDAATRSEVTDEIRVQCLYILNNITHWRGTLAQAVRQSLKFYANSR